MGTVLALLLADQGENPWLTGAALGVYATMLGAVLTVVVAPILKAHLAEKAAEAKLAREKRQRDLETAEAEAQAKVTENTESLAWLRSQIMTLMERQEAAVRRDADRQRQIEKLQEQVRGLREQLRERDSDDGARDGRNAQLEAALGAAKITVPPAAADYLALLDRESRRRRPRGEDT